MAALISTHAFAMNNCFTDMCSGSEAGSCLRLIDFVYHSTLGLRVIKEKKKFALQDAKAGIRAANVPYDSELACNFLFIKPNQPHFCRAVRSPVSSKFEV